MTSPGMGNAGKLANNSAPSFDAVIVGESTSVDGKLFLDGHRFARYNSPTVTTPAQAPAGPAFNDS
jgi:hypothetical protein